MRLRIVALAIISALSFVLIRISDIQLEGGETLRQAASGMWTRTSTLPVDRGTIFDRDGEELAVSIPAWAVSVNPKLVDDPDGIIRTLTSILNLDAAHAANVHAELVSRQRGFVYVARNVNHDIGQTLKSLKLEGVNVDPEDARILPGGDTAISIIGRTDIDGVGIAGLELQYDELLTGTPGESIVEVAPGGRTIPGTADIITPTVPGGDIILTVDRSVQFAAETVLIDRVSELEAKSGYVIVMETATGNILAMASVRRNGDNVDVTAANSAATNAYEPGSVAKVVTVAAALEEGTVTPDTTFTVPWRRKYYDDWLHDSHQHPDEEMTVTQILVESSNIGTIDIQQTLGNGDNETTRRTHWNYLKAFGFGQRTALDFPYESSGILKPWDDLWGSERVTVSYGQGFAATPLQLAAAINTVANDGVYVEPRLIDATVDSNGHIIDARPSDTHQVISSSTARQLQTMMRQTVCSGTASRAQTDVERYSIAGKTGTGLKAQANGTYLDDNGDRVYYASFAGFFPAEDPKVTIVVSIDEPPAGDINRFGGTAAAPVFAQLVPTVAYEQHIEPPTNPTVCTP